MLRHEAMEKARTDRFISVRDLSERTGIGQDTIKRWEAGILTPRLDNLIDVCDALNISIDRYIGRKQYG